MGKSVRDMWGMNAVAPFDAKAYYKDLTPTETIDSDIIVGIEVEVENHELKKNPAGVWSSKGDGSLRNNGVEWITRPIPARWAPHAMQDLLGESLHNECCFSPRTSIHVHFNVQNLDSAQVTDITLMYLAFEPLFFKFTGRGRIKNIYCVPIMDTNLMTGMNGGSSLPNIVDGWSKYTGLNLLPIRELGTIEARHMHGTFDHRKIATWIRLWTKLIEYVQATPTPITRRLLLEMGPMTDYQQLLHRIFGDDALALKYESPRDLERSVSSVKKAFLSSNTSAQLLKLVTKKSKYFEGN